eukprot:4316079-Pyramimonas_sp.AAC.1
MSVRFLGERTVVSDKRASFSKGDESTEMVRSRRAKQADRRSKTVKAKGSRNLETNTCYTCVTDQRGCLIGADARGPRRLRTEKAV